MRFATVSTGASTASGFRVDHCGSQVEVPTSSSGTSASASQRTTSACGSATCSTGPATSPAPRSSASRTASDATPSEDPCTAAKPPKIKNDRPRCRASPSAATAVAAPLPATRSFRWISRTPAASAWASWPGQIGPIAGYVDDQSGQRGSGASSPSRWASTRSGTRRPRVSIGRSGSSTSTKPLPHQRPARLQPRARRGAQPGRAGQLQRQTRPRRDAGSRRR